MDDWKKLLGTVAPLVGTALGGPLGGVAASFVADKLGLSEKTVSAVTDAIQGGKLDPAQVAQLKLAEIEFQKFLKQNDIDIEKVHAADRNSARDMLKATGSYVPATLTFMVTVGYFTTLFGMLQGWFKASDSQVMLIMLGQLGTAWGVTIAFWFGTTRNSQEKTTLLANSAPAK
jgi:hypothetical protein